MKQLLAKQYASLGLTGQKGPDGNGDMSGDEGESGFYRTVFNLYAIEGKSHQEIAQLLGIKADTSASQYHRARSLLAKSISAYKSKASTK